MYIDSLRTECVPEKAQYVCVSVRSEGTPTNGVDVPVFLLFAGESSLGFIEKIGDVVATYVRLDHVSYNNRGIMAVVGAMIGGNLRCGLTETNHSDFYSNIQLHDFSKDINANDINGVGLSEYISQMPVSRITADHHLFVSRHELANAYDQLPLDEHSQRVKHTIIKILKKSKSLGIFNQVSFITHCVYIMTAPTFAVHHLATLVDQSDNEAQYMELLKAESQAAKQLQTLFRDDLAQIFELQVLRNRVYDSVDWHKEIDHRTNIETVDISSNDVYMLARQIFEDGKLEGHTPRKMSWDHYWSVRWSMMPNGSVVSQYEHDRALKKMLPTEARVKSAWFSANLNHTYEYWCQRPPEIYASTSTKYEWGKVRALYGCDITSFLHADYSMGNCEDMLPSYFPVGNKANSRYISKVIEGFQETVPFCFDYDDFNSQHSNASMVAVLQAWIDTYQTGLTPEQLRSAEWTRDSINMTRVLFNDLKREVQLAGTLMSGWRLTSFMNTVLNRVYLMKAKLSEELVYSLHNGDDMFAGATSVQRALNVISAAKELGIRAQVAKTNIGTIGEFLRVDTRATNPCGQQYLARAVATMVHGRVETAAPNDLRALVNALTTRASEVVGRGGNKTVTDNLLNATLNFTKTLFSSSSEVMSALANLHPLQGGVCEEANIKSTRLEQARRTSDKEFLISKYSMIRPGVMSYIQEVVDRFQISNYDVSRESVLCRAAESLERGKISYEIVIETDEYADIYRGLYKAWHKSSFIPAIARARSLGLAPAKALSGINNTVANMISNGRDPVKMMNAIF